MADRESLEATENFDRSQRIDDICKSFAAAWHASQQPRIEDYLDKAPEARDELFVELLREEVFLRRAAGESVTAEEYVSRFPQHRETVARALGTAKAADPTGSTFSFARADEDSVNTPPPVNKTPSAPVADRYRKIRKLGAGAFGEVWLVEDLELRRQVALKEPRAERLRDAADLETYLSEARVLASLDHPHIVPVYDVGRTTGGSCYVVSKLIEGTNLAEYAEQHRLTFDEASKLVAQVAEALQHTHNRGLVHRDIKPANILVDSQGRPYVTDFGLALREDDFGKQAGLAGTPAYMSPEQARGEGHLVDGRSDIFSLGVVLYELLAGVRPFAGATWQEVLQQIATVEAKPLRQRNEAIPKELERICLRALSRRAADRYACAADLADDLRHWTEVGKLTESGDKALWIVPKGLRSFDAEDSSFFLELLPGPRDRDGLPETLRFWKTRLEETDPDKTFRVGLIYGPSGCGKSSLIKAGLLPRLADHVIRVFVEATPDETESRLLHGLRRACQDLPREATLAETLTALRRGKGIPAGRKVVLVLDQFEQWLHAHGAEQNTELAAAIRQCDGQRIQAVLLVRDDFWMPATRLLKELETPLLEGHNAAAVDLFDPLHARKVLAEFGKAYGRLPRNLGELSTAETSFLDEAVGGLAQDGKVICVRLALFADMLKSRPWTPASLKEVGGTEGVGVTFLEETFSATTAPPEHRYHQKAARGVLQALLPESGTDIKGHMRSYAELLEASGYAARPKDFDDLIRILDGEIRLITPTDPDGNEEVLASRLSDGERYYQLTHDYLVHSLRDWLTQKQRETRRGRAELRLAERAAVWSSKRENRRLPSSWEYLNFRFFAKKRNWTAPQRKMMQTARRVHAVRWASAFAILLATGLTILKVFAIERDKILRSQVETAVVGVLASRGAGVTGALINLRMLPENLVEEELTKWKRKGSKSRGLLYALARFGDVDWDVLIPIVATATPDEKHELVWAFSLHLPLESLRRIHAATDSCNADQDWRFKARLAILSLYLGDASIAAEMCQVENRADPLQRTTFIDEFSAWNLGLDSYDFNWSAWSVEGYSQQVLPGESDAMRLSRMFCGAAAAIRAGRSAPINLAAFAKLLDEPALRSGVCLALGSVGPEHMDDAIKNDLTPIVLTWYLTAPDGGTHSAAGWALRQWKQELPPIATTSAPPADRQWYVNGQGQTMIQLPSGTFTMGTPGAVSDSNETPHKVRLTRGFYLGDREVTVEQFMRFVDDKEYRAAEKPARWKEAYELSKSYSPTLDSPVLGVDWFDAVFYCNWLSAKEGLRPAYERTGEKWKWKDYQGQGQEYDAWRCDFTASGYRLPTEAEWEFACRASTSIAFSFGDDEDLLTRYGWIVSNSKNRVWPGGLKLPNGWGLFDMHGNAWEWCYDPYGPYSTGESKAIDDPVGSERSDSADRVLRGGTFLDEPSFARSANRNFNLPDYGGLNNGLRLARTHP